MATSSRLCSDEELQKARADLRQLLARSGVAAGESKAPGHVEGGSEGEGREKKKKDEAGKEKKKKMFVLPQEQVDMILNFRCRPFPKNEMIHKMAQEDEETYGDMSAMLKVADVLTRNYHDIIRGGQEELRRVIETKGYYAYEATDDEADSGNESERAGPRERGCKRRWPGM